MHEISPANLDDLPQLVELLNFLFTQEADFTPDAAKQEQGLRLILSQPEVGRIFCARQNDKVVAMVSLLFTVSTAEGGRAGWLEDMVVHPDLRGQGIGQSLLNHAVNESRSLGCTRLTLLTDASNRAAMRFYTRAEFVRSKMVPFRLKL